MKYYFLLVYILFLSFSLNAQIEPIAQDSVFLLNGKIIVGKILNPGSKGSIQVQTPGNTIIYISESQVLKKSINTIPISNHLSKSKETVVHRVLIDDQFNFSVSAGMSLPSGSFSSSNSQYAGFAKTGSFFQASAWVRTRNQLFWSTQFLLVNNPFNKSEFSTIQETQLNVKVLTTIASPWRAIHLNSGITWTTELNDDFQLFIQAQIGLIRMKAPGIRFYTNNGFIYTLESVKGNGFTRSLGIGLVYHNRYSLSLSMLTSKLYIPYNNQTIYQPYRIFGFQLGYYLLRFSN